MRLRHTTDQRQAERDLEESERRYQAARAAEAALVEQHAELQAIIDNSPVMIFTQDRQHRFVLANSEFERMLGLRTGEVLGRTEKEVLPPDDAARMWERNERILTTGERQEFEESVPAPEGSGRRTFLAQKFPLRDAEGEVYGLCGILTDISERKEREEELLSKVEWSSRIREAIASDRFTLHAQPIVDLKSGSFVQEELLIRWVGADGELTMPGDFLPAAERFGLAPEIDRWVVSKAAAMARHRRVEVNLSGKSIGDPTLPGFIEVELAASGADPANVVFEITETAAAEDFDQARRLADRLTRVGCGFALDDFGTGFGSFTYLKHLPVSFIKIDYEFVRKIAHDESNRRVVHSMIGVARDFGIETIAEGVESAETLELLTEMGVDYAQGFHIARPAAAS
jgi:PAS domain S-box-containing protein